MPSSTAACRHEGYIYWGADWLAMSWQPIGACSHAGSPQCGQMCTNRAQQGDSMLVFAPCASSPCSISSKTAPGSSPWLMLRVAPKSTPKPTFPITSNACKQLAAACLLFKARHALLACLHLISLSACCKTGGFAGVARGLVYLALQRSVDVDSRSGALRIQRVHQLPHDAQHCRKAFPAVGQQAMLSASRQRTSKHSGLRTQDSALSTRSTFV